MAYADREPLVAVEVSLAQNDFSLRLEIRRTRAQRSLRHHLHRNPTGPIRTLHVTAAGTLLEARIDLRGAIVLPGPMPGHRLEIDAAGDRPRSYRVVGHLPRKIKGAVGDEHDVIVAVDGTEQGRIVFFALARIGAGLELPVGHNARAEFLRRLLECLDHGGVGRKRAF